MPWVCKIPVWTCYFLDCYLIVEEFSSEEGLIESEGYAKTTRGFRLAWPVTAGINPTSVSIVSKHGTLLTDEFEDLMNFEYIAI